MTLLSDWGERYVHSYYDPGWLGSHGFDVRALCDAVKSAAEDGRPLPPLAACTAEQRHRAIKPT